MYPAVLDLSAARPRAAIAALGPNCFGGSPEANGAATWAALRQTRRLGRVESAPLSRDDLEAALHSLRPWAPDERCNCGWRAQEIWRRAADIAAGRESQTMTQVDLDWLGRL